MTHQFRASGQNAHTQNGEQQPVEDGHREQTATGPLGADAIMATAQERLRETRKEPARMTPRAAFQTAEPPSRAELLARYRRQRGLPEDHHGEDGRAAVAFVRHDRIAVHTRPAARLAERLKAAEGEHAAEPRPRLTVPQTLAVAITMAMAAGVGLGLASARFFASGNGTPPLAAVEATAAKSGIAPLAPLRDTSGMQGAAQRTTVIAKKSVPIATLQVADVTGETNSYIPLTLHAEPAGLGGDIMLKISGLPEGAYLTSGRKAEEKVWSLTLPESRDVKLVVPEARDPHFDLAVAAFEPKTGELAAPIKTMTVALSNVTIEPVSAPPPQRVSDPEAKATRPPPAAFPAPIPPPDSESLALQAPPTRPETHQLVLDGDEALRSGNIKAARSAFEKAWSKGVAEGAFGLGRSYDPVVLRSLDLARAKPDKAKAIAWYERAASAGNADATAAIVRLKLKP